MYLVSILKASYLIATCAYSLQFCAVYFVSVVQQYWSPVSNQTKWHIWGVMFTFVLLYSAAAFFFYRRQETLSQLLRPAKIMFYTSCINVAVFILLLACFGSDNFRLWIYTQLCKSGDLTLKGVQWDWVPGDQVC